MTTTASTRGGSGVHARTRTPSLQLHRLAEHLVQALKSVKTEPQPAASLISRDGDRLIINPRAALARLVTDPGFLDSFAPGEDSGFIRDIELPPLGTTAKVGGRLLPGSEAATSKAVENLQAAVTKVLEEAITGLDLKTLCFADLRTGLAQMGETVNEYLPSPPAEAQLVPVSFAAEPRRTDERARDVARVFSAIETIDGTDCFEALLINLATRLRKKDIDDEEIAAIVASLRSQRELPGTQMPQFLEFLNEEALARVRLQVSMRIMHAIAEHAPEHLADYVARVRAAYDLFAGSDGQSLLLDGSSAWGFHGRIDIAEELRKALFYTCLPVWAEWATQLYESRVGTGRGFRTLREVSYRFRVNGAAPDGGTTKLAFDRRLDRLEETFEQAANEKSTPYLPRALAQLAFLYVVTPGQLDETRGTVQEEFNQIAEGLKLHPKETAARMLKTLRHRSATMQAVARELITILQNRSRRVLDTVSKTIDAFTVSVHHNVIDWSKLISMSAPTTGVFVTAERGDPKIAWFSHLTISESPAVPGSIVSYTVHTRLTERSLAPSGEPRLIPVSRPLSEAHLPIRLVPYRRLKEAGWVPDAAHAQAFDAKRGIEIQYDERFLALNRKQVDSAKDRVEQLRTASVCAFLLLVYVTLWEIVRRIREAHDGRAPSATLVRLQTAGRESKDEEGAAAIYAVSQALEKALARELPIKLQGFVSSETANSTLRWRSRGALHALTGGQSLVFQMDGALDKVALVSYVTRPCDTHPLYADAHGYLFIARTYVAERLADGTAVLKVDRMHSRFVDGRKEFGTPQLILEEIARLGTLGFEHVILLSHHFGNRHLGRAAEHHAPHGTREFLDGAIARYPAMNIYTLRRDVFPAMRLRRRAAGESCFEVTQFDDHKEMYRDPHVIDTRVHMPIYTFATLVTPDERGRPQSGFCTYFYDVDERISEAGERMRHNALGFGAGSAVRTSLVSVLRAVHFLESEKPADKIVWLPVLDPYSWMTPVTNAEAGELTVMSRRTRGPVYLSFPALLSHVTKILHKEAT